jgi:hypothetical protein
MPKKKNNDRERNPQGLPCGREASKAKRGGSENLPAFRSGKPFGFPLVVLLSADRARVQSTGLFLLGDDASPVPAANIFLKFCNHMVFYDNGIPVAPPLEGSRRQDMSRLRDLTCRKASYIK